MKYIIIFVTLISTMAFGQDARISVKKLAPVSAIYPGGNDSLIRYFNRSVLWQIASRLNAINKIHFRTLVIISENGGVTKVDLIKGSGYKDIDSIFVDAVRRMPSWIPATNEIGIKCKDKKSVTFKIQ